MRKVLARLIAGPFLAELTESRDHALSALREEQGRRLEAERIIEEQGQVIGELLLGRIIEDDGREGE